MRKWTFPLTGLVCSLLVWGTATAGDRSITAHFEAHTPGSPQSVDHAPWDAFLKAYVSEGPGGVNRVDYGSVTLQDREALKAYIAKLAQTDVSALDRGTQFAYWVNLYNALTARVVLDAYPVKSIRRITLGRLVAIGPWGQPILVVEDRELSLDNIEHDILRALWRDPRIHYAVNCASVGCPNLMREAFTAENAERLLEKGAFDYINHPRGVSFDDEKLKVSSIYKWFKEDFGGTDQGVISHLKIYAGADLEGRLEGRTKIDRYGYDWALNDIATPKADVAP